MHLVLGKEYIGNEKLTEVGIYMYRDFREASHIPHAGGGGAFSNDAAI